MGPVEPEAHNDDPRASRQVFSRHGCRFISPMDCVGVPHFLDPMRVQRHRLGPERPQRRRPRL